MSKIILAAIMIATMAQPPMAQAYDCDVDCDDLWMIQGDIDAMADDIEEMKEAQAEHYRNMESQASGTATERALQEFIYSKDPE